MSIDATRLEENRNGNGSGVAVVLYLDIHDEDYVAAGEPGDNLVLAVGREASVAIWQSLSGLTDCRGAAVLSDEAARALGLFLALGVDRQAFLSQALDGLTDGLGKPGDPSDPMFGYQARHEQAEVVQEGREQASRAKWEQEQAERRREFERELDEIGERMDKEDRAH